MHVPIGSGVAFAMVVGTGGLVLLQWGVPGIRTPPRPSQKKTLLLGGVPPRKKQMEN
jgi:hypothetical protein